MSLSKSHNNVLKTVAHLISKTKQTNKTKQPAVSSLDLTLEQQRGRTAAITHATNAQQAAFRELQERPLDRIRGTKLEQQNTRLTAVMTHATMTQRDACTTLQPKHTLALLTTAAPTHRQRHRRMPAKEPTHLLLARTHKFIGTYLAQSTLKQRVAVGERFLQFCDSRRIQPTETTACAWVMTVAHKASSRLNYLTHIKSILHPPPLLTMMARALRKRSAEEPLKQAIPIDWRQLGPHLHNFTPKERTALMILTRGAARADELIRLRGEQVLLAAENSIVIWWRERTKSTQEDPFLPQTWLEITPPEDLPTDTIKAINTMKEAATVLRRLQPTDQLIRPREFDRLTKKVAQLLNLEVTGHSFKRGAAQRAVRALLEKQLDPRLLGRLERHTESNPLIRSGDLRYAAGTQSRETGINIARLLSTGQLTKYL